MKTAAALWSGLLEMLSYEVAFSIGKLPDSESLGYTRKGGFSASD
jgi:hypothetical protein